MLKAKEMLYRIENAKVLKGRSIDSKVALVIFMTARNLKRPKKPKEIMEYIRTSEYEINQCYKVLQKANIFQPFETRLLPADIVDKEGTKLGLAFDILEAAKRTAIKFKEEGVCEGKKPATIAGASLFMAILLSKEKNNLNYGIDEISRAVGIGHAAIMECYSQAKPFSHRLLP